MRRKTPIRRKTWLRSRRPTDRRSTRVRDPEYMAWIRRQPCAASALSPCHGRVEADHTGRRGYGQRAHDATCIPLCHSHHMQRADFSGPFKTWDQYHMRRWLDGVAQRFSHEYATVERRPA